MKTKLITAVSNPDHEGLKQLKKSLNRFEYDYHVITNPNINWNWAGLKDIHEWCKSEEAKEYTHFLYTDGFDTMALTSMAEVERKYQNMRHVFYGDQIIFSTEKQCFPRVDWVELHPETTTEWKYLNHGQFIAPIKMFIDLYEGVFDKSITCQEWAMDLYLKKDPAIGLDLNCDIFQTIAFKSPEDFEIRGGRIYNTKQNSFPCFAHGNGRTDMAWVYELNQ